MIAALVGRHKGIDIEFYLARDGSRPILRRLLRNLSWFNGKTSTSQAFVRALVVEASVTESGDNRNCCRLYCGAAQTLPPTIVHCWSMISPAIAAADGTMRSPYGLLVIDAFVIELAREQSRAAHGV